MTRLYSNENFPLPVVEELRRLGHDVLTIQETGQANQSLSDEAVLAFASAEGRPLIGQKGAGMITVGYLKKRLAEIPDNALVYAYEGEVVGIIIVGSLGEDRAARKVFAVIHANESEEIQDNQEAA